MKARKYLMTAAAVAALIPLGVAVAGDNDQYANKSDQALGASFKKLDTNKDGRISQAEAAVDSTVVFASADLNGDGYIDSEEWMAAAKAGSKPQSESQDTTPADSPTPDTDTPRQ
jgi:Ca2+-binding EF-hand superfamily protein